MKGLTLGTLVEVIREMTEERVRIEKIYLDVGANIVGENIIVGDDDMQYQLLSISDLDKLNKGKYTLEDVTRNIETVTKMKNLYI